jgi:RimJ/RimL family protein N-acetyltransferase
VLSLLVHPENERARACYDELGFRHDGRIPGTFERDDAIRLVRDPEEVV